MVGIPGRGQSLGALVVSITTDLRGLQTGLTRADAKVSASTRLIEKRTAIAGKAILGLGAAFLITAGIIGKAAANYESDFAGIRKTVNATEKEFEQLDANLKKLSLTIPVSAGELANITEIAGQLGVKGVSNLTKFTKTIALLGLTTNIQGEQAALQLSRFINILGEDQGDVDRIGSALVELGNNFAAREDEILQLSLSLASFGRQIGLTAGDVLAFATIIKASGGESQAAGTAFQKVALTLKDAVITGSADLEDFAKIIGTTGEQVQKTFRDDATEAIVQFIEGLKRIEDAGGSVKQALASVGLADQRLIREFGKITSSTDDLRDALSKSNTQIAVNNALVLEAAKRIDTANAQLKIMANNINLVAIKLGDKLLPAVRALNIAFSVLNGTFQEGALGLKKAFEGDDKVLQAAKLKLVELNEIRNKLIKEKDSEGSFFSRKVLEEEIRLIELQEQKLKELIGTRTIFAGPPEEEEDEEQLDPATVVSEIAVFQQEILGLNAAALQSRLDELNRTVAQEKSIEEQKTLELKKQLKLRIAAEEKAAQLEQAIRTQSFSLASALITSFVGNSKSAAIALKAIRIGEVIIDGMAAIATIQAKWAAIPPVAAALVTKQKISTALQVATIAATGFATGTDSVPANLTPGEMVIPRSFSDAIRTGNLTLGGPEGRGGAQRSNQPSTIIIEAINITTEGPLDLDTVPEIVEEIGIQTENELRGA